VFKCLFREKIVTEPAQINEQALTEMNPFEFVALKADLAVMENKISLRNAKKLMIPDFDWFIENKAEKEFDSTLFENHRLEIPTEPMDLNAPYEDTGSITLEDNAYTGYMSQTPEHFDSQGSAEKYEIQSNVGSFVPDGNGIFQEASFFVMETENSFNSHKSFQSELNVRRTMAKLKKLGSGSSDFVSTKGKFNRKSKVTYR
jgi:hypothetical protein